MLGLFHKYPRKNQSKEQYKSNKSNPNYKSNKSNKSNYVDELSIDYLVKEVMQTFNKILRANVYENNFTKDEIEDHINQKKELRKALRNCAYGDKLSKIYVKDYIKDIMLKKYNVNSVNIDTIIFFGDRNKLSSQDMFDIMLYTLEREYKDKALDFLIKEYHLAEPKSNEDNSFYYEITSEDITNAYVQMMPCYLSYNDKISILTQRVYQLYKGNGVIDQIRDMKIDGVSAGVSGIPEGFELENVEDLKDIPASYDSVWIFYKGKSIHLSFLSFLSYKELIRVCKNIYKYNNPGQLSEATGYIINEMKDGSRVSVARPPFAESWVLFIRKFDSVLQENINNLITDQNNEIAIGIMKWLIKGCQIIGVTGEQGSGKTTLLIALIGFINPTYNLRIQELSFELHLRKIYPKRNIVTFRETDTISGQDGLDFQKKTDGTVNILGEVATAPVANWLVQMALVASLFTIFTHHAKTTEDLVISLRNALLLEGGFHNEKVATEQVVDAIRFDIHMKKKVNGHRYIERITEIIPQKRSEHREIQEEKRNAFNDLTGEMFETRDIVVFEQGKYILKNIFSNPIMEQIYEHLNESETVEFVNNLFEWGRLSNGAQIK